MWAPREPAETPGPLPQACAATNPPSPASPPAPKIPWLLPTSPSPSGSIPVGSGSLSPLARPPPTPGDPAARQPGSSFRRDPFAPLTAGVLFRGAGEAVTLSPLPHRRTLGPEPRKKPRVHSGWGAGEGEASSVLGRNCSKTHN